MEKLKKISFGHYLMLFGTLFVVAILVREESKYTDSISTVEIFDSSKNSYQAVLLFEEEKKFDSASIDSVFYRTDGTTISPNGSVLSYESYNRSPKEFEYNLQKYKKNNVYMLSINNKNHQSIVDKEALFISVPVKFYLADSIVDQKNIRSYVGKIEQKSKLDHFNF